MKFPLPADTFPPLALSEEDERRLEETAELIVQKTVRQYHEYLTLDKGVVDEKHWKKIKTRDSLRSYTERRASVNGNNNYSSSTSNASSSSPIADGASNTNGELTTSLLTVGSMPGTLDDVMYCVVNARVEDVMLKSVYTEDSFVDWRLLATIITPSKRDPYRSLSIKWGVKKNPRLVGTVLRIRDVVYVESTGTAVTPAASASDVALSVCKYVHCAEMKKLTRIIMSSSREQQRSRTRFVSAASASSIGTSSNAGSSESSLATNCALCSRSVGGRRMPFASSSSSKEKSCCICDERICSRFRMHKTVFLPDKLHQVDENTKLTGTNMVICTRCIYLTMRESSHAFAVLDARAAQGESVDYGLQGFVHKADARST